MLIRRFVCYAISTDFCSLCKSSFAHAQRSLSYRCLSGAPCHSYIQPFLHLLRSTKEISYKRSYNRALKFNDRPFSSINLNDFVSIVLFSLNNSQVTGHLLVVSFFTPNKASNGLISIFLSYELLIYNFVKTGIIILFMRSTCLLPRGTSVITVICSILDR